MSSGAGGVTRMKAAILSYSVRMKNKYELAI